MVPGTNSSELFQIQPHRFQTRGFRSQSVADAGRASVSLTVAIIKDSHKSHLRERGFGLAYSSQGTQPTMVGPRQRRCGRRQAGKVWVPGARGWLVTLRPHPGSKVGIVEGGPAL